MKRRSLTDSEAIRRALHNAIEWNDSLIDAHTPMHGGKPHEHDAKMMALWEEEIQAWRDILARRYGIVHSGRGMEMQSVSAWEVVLTPSSDDDESSAKLKGEKRPPLCDECGVNRADPPSHLCPGCQAYRDHTA